MKIEVIRTCFNPLYTKGIMFVDNIFFGYTLEPQRKRVDETSHINRCINTGEYLAKYEYSPKFRQHLIELKNVPNRSEIKIHAGNFSKDTQGCILVGGRSDVGCVLDSKIAIELLNTEAYNAVNRRKNIFVEVKEYLFPDDRITDELLQKSRL